jgi:seryl-tRNA synthetase
MTNLINGSVGDYLISGSVIVGLLTWIWQRREADIKRFQVDLDAAKNSFQSELNTKASAAELIELRAELRAVTATGHALQQQSTKIEGRMELFLRMLEGETKDREKSEITLTKEVRDGKHDMRSDLQSVETRIMSAITDIKSSLPRSSRRETDDR